MRFLVVASAATLLLACGPSDTIDVTAPPAPSPARPDGGRGPEGSGGEPGGAGGSGGGGAGGGAGEAPVAPVDAATPGDLAVDASDDAPVTASADASVVMEAAAEAPAPMVDAPPARLDTMPAPPRDAAPPVDARPADMGAPPAAGCLPAPAMDEVISLFEDGNLGSRRVDARGGTFWGAINASDGATATVSVAEMAARCGSSRALRFAGTTTTITPILRLPLVMGAAQFYDASAYRGVRFFLRAGVASRVRMKLPDRNTTSFGGMCQVCNDHWGVDLEVGTDWKPFSISFASLNQSGSGDDEESLDEAALFGIEFVVRNLAAFELFIDDVSFFR